MRSVLFAAAIGSLLVAGAGVAGTARPDLVERAVVASKQTVAAGSQVRVRDTLANIGLAASSSSTVGYYLSRDRLLGRLDARLGRRRVSALAAGGVSKGSKVVRMPASGRGTYRILACADDRQRVREADERNNCRATAALRVTASRDLVPPTFAGLEAATTCIPGPVGEGRSGIYRLTWSAAADNVTPRSAIVYDVYQATAAGRQDFSRPTYTTPAGDTVFNTPPLSSDNAYYFVVRARDAAGNRDSNRIELAGRNLCL